jgi:hypothetical protein
MKSTGALKFIFVTIAAVILSGCQEKFTTEVPSGLNEKIEFILKEDAIYLQTASIRVKHNGSEDTQWVYMQTEDLTTDADQLISDRVKVESELTDQVVSHKGMNISINLKNLKAKQTYRLIVKAIDPKTGKLYGKVADFVFKTRRDPDVWEENANWSVSRKNERTQGIAEGSSEVIEFENFECVSSDEESYMVLTLSKDDYNNYKKDEHHQDKIRTIFEDYHADMSSLDNFEEYILKGNAVWKEQRLRSGDYVTYMIGVDKDGELSGLYKKADISIAQETPTEGYNKRLGWWEISFSNGSAPWNVYIDDLDANMWYLSIGWEPEAISEQVYNLGLKLYFDKSTDKIYFISQEVATAQDGTTINYYGTFPYGTYQTVLDIENVRLAEAKITDLYGTQAKISALGTTLAGVGDVSFTYSLFYISYGSSSIAASGSIPPYPWTMKKIASPN